MTDNTIKLGKNVVISDPCYTIPTWCQVILNNVLPGEYRVFCKKHDSGDWGVRNSMLLAVHKDHEFSKLKWDLESSRGIIGVDSGQAGIFDLAYYRRDDVEVPMGDGDSTFFGEEFDREDGDKWYRHICSHTLGKNGWGSYDNGVVSSSGFGDGGYDLFVARHYGKVIAIAIEFNVEETKEIDFDWYKNVVIN